MALMALSACSTSLPNHRITQSAGPSLQAQFDEAVAAGGLEEVTSFEVSDGELQHVTGWVGETLIEAIPSPHDATEYLHGFYGGSKPSAEFDLAGLEERLASLDCDGYVDVMVTPSEAIMESAHCDGQVVATWLDGAALPTSTIVTDRDSMSSLFAQAKAIAGDSFTKITVYETGSTFEQLISSRAGIAKITTHVRDSEPPTIDGQAARNDDTPTFSLAAVSGEYIWDTMAIAAKAEGVAAAKQVPFKLEVMFGKLRADANYLDRDVLIG